MRCPECGSSKLQKNGRRRGRQQYRCKDCDRQFTEKLMPWGYSEDARKICIRMYRLGLTLRETERLTGISHSAISNWVRQTDQGEKKRDKVETDEEDRGSSSSLVSVPLHLA